MILGMVDFRVEVGTKMQILGSVLPFWGKFWKRGGRGGGGVDDARKSSRV